LSGVKRTERNRTPTASNTAFEIALGTTAADGSPPQLLIVPIVNGAAE
jgi:hypothetical protein